MSDNSFLPIELSIFDGDKLLAKQVIDQTKVIIGRILSADFRISDSRISRIHALLERLEDGKFRLTDLASTHGTFVNGERIVEKIITLNDEISFASLKARIERLPELPSRSAAPAAKVSRSPKPSAQAKAPIDASLDLPSSQVEGNVVSQVQVGPGGHAVAVTREPTVIRSLKETARTRGVLDPAGPTEELEVTVYWEDSVLHVDHYKQKGSTLRLGDGPGNTYIVPSNLVPDHFEFVKVQGGSAEIFLHSIMQGSARVQGRMQTLDELRKSGRSSVVLSGQDIAKIRVGSVNFFLMFVPEPLPVPGAPLFDQGGLYWGLQATFAAAAILFLTLGMIFRQPIEGQVREFPERLRKILVEEYVKQVDEQKQEAKKELTEEKMNAKKIHGPIPKKAETVPDAQLVDKEAHRGGNEGEGARERGAEGKRGLRDAKHKTGITNRPKVSWTKKVHDAPKKAHSPGGGAGAPSLLDSLKNSGLGAKIAKVAGSGDSAGAGGATGNDPLDKAFSGVGGGAIRSGQGSGGSGLQGNGRGGGGNAVGVGGLGAKGFGGGAHGDGVGSIPGKGEAAIGTETAEVEVLGSLTREEIERVVNAHRNEIQFCYSRELQRDPHLSGKIALKWTIISGGQVTNLSSASNSTGSRALSNCIMDKVRNWRFPSPRGGSQAQVDWPWVFKPQGS
jgi:TonB family protein